MAFAMLMHHSAIRILKSTGVIRHTYLPCEESARPCRIHALACFLHGKSLDTAFDNTVCASMHPEDMLLALTYNVIMVCLAWQDVHITGIDPNLAMQEFAQSAAEDAGLKPDQLQLMAGRAEKLPVPSDSCDVAVCTLVRFISQSSLDDSRRSRTLGSLAA